MARTGGEVVRRGPEGKRWLGVLAVLGPMLAIAGALGGQAAPAYHPLLLDRARYRQEVRTTIELESRGARSREQTLRDGVMTIRAAARDSLITVEAWFDTLFAWREGAGERLEPGTDGLIGGRYLGLLTRQGGMSVVDRPFVPDELAQVADLGDALTELLPILPPSPLAVGGGWRDPLGVVLLRLADGRRDGRRVERYRLTRRFAREEQHLLPDSTTVLARRQESEVGTYEWSPESGLVRWERAITTEVEVPAGGPVRQPFRTRIEQQATVTRVGG